MSRISKDKTIKKFVYLFFCLSILTIPVNVSFFNIIRFSDIFFITSFIIYTMSNPSIKSIDLTIVSIFFGILLLSSLFSILHNNNIKYNGLGFYYKYLLIFLIPWIVLDIVNNKKRLIRIVSILYYIYLFLIIWVYIYYILRSENIIHGNPRVSYPFSDYHMSDAHVYSSYLSFTFIAYQEYIKKMLVHTSIHSYIVSILAVGAILLTGSKTGLLIISIYFIIICIRFIRHLSKKNLMIIIITTITLSIASIILINTPNDNDSLNYAYLYDRATTYDVEADSINGRLQKGIRALNEISPNYLLIGNGPTGASMKWYDGGVSILLAHGGVLVLLTLIIYIYMILARSKRMVMIGKTSSLHKVFTLLLFIYLLLNVITEHFLITRNLLPVATLLSVIYANIKLNYIESYVHAKHLDSLNTNDTK